MAVGEFEYAATGILTLSRGIITDQRRPIRKRGGRPCRKRHGFGYALRRANPDHGIQHVFSMPAASSTTRRATARRRNGGRLHDSPSARRVPQNLAALRKIGEASEDFRRRDANTRGGKPPYKLVVRRPSRKHRQKSANQMIKHNCLVRRYGGSSLIQWVRCRTRHEWAPARILSNSLISIVFSR